MSQIIPCFNWTPILERNTFQKLLTEDNHNGFRKHTGDHYDILRAVSYVTEVIIPCFNCYSCELLFQMQWMELHGTLDV